MNLVNSEINNGSSDNNNGISATMNRRSERSSITLLDVTCIRLVSDGREKALTLLIFAEELLFCYSTFQRDFKSLCVKDYDIPSIAFCEKENKYLKNVV